MAAGGLFADDAAANGNGGHHSALDQFVAPGLRLWMLIGLVSGVLLIMIVIVCCFMKIRIPRTKREIERMAEKRRERKKKRRENGRRGENGTNPAEHYEEARAQTIVMNSLASRPAKSERIHTAGPGSHRRENI